MIIYDLMTELKLINVTSENTKRKNKISYPSGKVKEKSFSVWGDKIVILFCDCKYLKHTAKLF